MTKPRRILGVTGTRAEFGLLTPVFQAIAARGELQLLVAVSGAHLIGPTCTRNEVAAMFPIAAEIPMQVGGETGRIADALAFARGVHGCALTIDALRPDVVLVLGDRIEAFAAASAAAIAGVRVAHLHGGDRAEGIADDAMRHAISKLAHVHFAASPSSAERLLRMGEDAARIQLVGSPAIDGLEQMPPLSDAEYLALGRPDIVLALHPTGRTDAEEEAGATMLIDTCRAKGRTLVLDPNSDPGRDGIMRAIDKSDLARAAHFKRPQWIGLLRRIRLLVGNSSAGLIEAAALRVRTLNVGSRQSGRERASNVVDCGEFEASAIQQGIDHAWTMADPDGLHPFGLGRTGEMCAEFLASPVADRLTVTKRNSY
ncbi:MAG: UDP-N-acetylglucosamine 2-epimerase [Phycisphaerae bacterium]|nr:UDP-N-acetylglucosamine 2-epimerase [Phycisphaerae bacterium]